MIRYKTYSNVLNTLTCIGELHKQIQATSTGDIWDIDLEKNTKFPLYHINPTNVEVSMSQQTFNFQIFVMDIVEPDKSNEQEVLSETLQITTDIIALLKHGELLHTASLTHGEEARYYVEDDFTCEPFTERFDNTLTGWVVDLPVIIESVLDSCDIPINQSVTCIK